MKQFNYDENEMNLFHIPLVAHVNVIRNIVVQGIMYMKNGEIIRN